MVAGSSPPIANPRHARVLRRMAHRLKARGGTSGLGRRGVDGPHGQVVRAARGVELGGRMGREPDEALRADGGTGRRDGYIVLAYVHAVGLAGRDEVGAVVEDEQRTACVARGAEGARGLDEHFVARRLVAELDEVDPAVQRRVEERPRSGVAHQIEPRLREALALVVHARQSVRRHYPG